MQRYFEPLAPEDLLSPSFSLPLQPMVDTASGPESPTLQHFATVIAAAEAAVNAAGVALAAAVADHESDVASRHRASKVQRWRDASAQCAAMQASGDALAARNATDGAPADAGSAGLREAVFAAAEAVMIFEQVPKGDPDAVSDETSAALEAAVARANRLLAAASAAIGRRPERASVRARLDDLQAKCAAADARLAATHARIAAAQAGLPADSPAVVAAHAAVGNATHYAAAATKAIDACRAATAADAASDTTVGRDSLPGVAQAVVDYEAAAAAVAAAAADVDRASEAEHARTGSEALRHQEERLEAVRRRYDALDLRVLPAGVTFAQAQRADGAPSGPVPVKLDPALPPTQRAVAAVQDAGLRLVNAAAVRPMVDASAGADSPTLRHFSAAVDAADSAVRQAELVLEAAAHNHLQAAAAKERSARQERWNDAVAQVTAVQATIDALAARNAADGSPTDAGSTALREATASASEAHAAVSRFALGAAPDAVAEFDDIIALEQMATRAREAAGAATKAMGRRPDHAAVRQALDDLHLKHSASSARLGAVRERLEAVRGVLPASAPSVRATLEALDHAERHAASQAELLATCRTAADKDAQTIDSTEAREAVPRAAAAHSGLEAAVARAAEALEGTIQTRDAEARRSGAALLATLEERLAAAKRTYDGLDLRALPAGTTSAFPQSPLDGAAALRGPAPEQLDPLLVGTQRAVAAIQGAGMQLLHADAVRVSTERQQLTAPCSFCPSPPTCPTPFAARRRRVHPRRTVAAPLRSHGRGCRSGRALDPCCHHRRRPRIFAVSGCQGPRGVGAALARRVAAPRRDAAADRRPRSALHGRRSSR